MMIYHDLLILVGGFNPSEKYEFVSWDYEIPNMMGKKNHVPNHQPVIYYNIYIYLGCLPIFMGTWRL